MLSADPTIDVPVVISYFRLLETSTLQSYVNNDDCTEAWRACYMTAEPMKPLH